jgi:hypothetical protein
VLNPNPGGGRRGQVASDCPWVASVPTDNGCRMTTVSSGWQVSTIRPCAPPPSKPVLRVLLVGSLIEVVGLGEMVAQAPCSYGVARLESPWIASAGLLDGCKLVLILSHSGSSRYPPPAAPPSPARTPCPAPNSPIAICAPLDFALEPARLPVIPNWLVAVGRACRARCYVQYRRGCIAGLSTGRRHGHRTVVPHHQRQPRRRSVCLLCPHRCRQHARFSGMRPRRGKLPWRAAHTRPGALPLGGVRGGHGQSERERYL